MWLGCGLTDEEYANLYNSTPIFCIGCPKVYDPDTAIVNTKSVGRKMVQENHPYFTDVAPHASPPSTWVEATEAVG